MAGLLCLVVCTGPGIVASVCGAGSGTSLPMLAAAVVSERRAGGVRTVVADDGADDVEASVLAALHDAYVSQRGTLPAAEKCLRCVRQRQKKHTYRRRKGRATEKVRFAVQGKIPDNHTRSGYTNTLSIPKNHTYEHMP
uniref:Uncharacterized protein n=1 Tax=Branchiostoma floridae TaxID=7739 RepID=C3ZXW5_BRAFL|eukprot:XP_002586614.1 hypothetical protein BRAFLDRAFT_106124 [Branchiostoma floridae]